MYNVKYNLWICDKDYNKLGRVNWIFLQYSNTLNSVRQAYFTVQTQDPAFKEIDFRPLDEAYCCIIEREGVEVFRGELDKFTTPGKRTPYGEENEEAYNTLDRIGFNASGIEQRLEDIIVKPNADSEIYGRSFNDVALGDIVSTLINEAKQVPDSPLTLLQVGTMENPLDKAGNIIKLQDSQQLYAQTTMAWIRLLSDLGLADWYTEGTTFNFVKHKGVDRGDQVVMRLRKGEKGDLAGIRLSIDRVGMANKVVVIGAQEGINQVVREAKDDESIRKFGLREIAVPIRVLDTETTAQQYADSVVNETKQTLPLNGIQMYPNQEHVPFGEFDLGDTITLDVGIDFMTFRKKARVVGGVVSVTENAMERVYYALQEPT